ncbi:MAG: hypothetical protein ACI923_001366 [Flavobacteriales bacterium]|jgi:hypothetical protein
MMNYNLLLLLFCLLIQQHSIGQSSNQLETAKQMQSFDEIGVDAWWQLVEAQPAAEQAWLNLYLAERFERWGNAEKELSNKDKSALQDVQIGVEFNVPNSFADHYIRFISSNFKDLEALVLAEYSRANDPLILKARIDYETIYGSKTKLNAGLALWGTAVNPSAPIISYSKNILLSLPLNALLLTNGDDDTYPLLFVQEKEKFRKDVRIIQLDLMSSSDYRAKVAEMINCSSSAFDPSSRKALFESIILADQSKKVHLPFSLPGKWIQSKSDLFEVRGLCLEPLNESSVQDENVNQVIWETMDKTFVQSSHQFARNYLPLLIRLHQSPTLQENQKEELLYFLRDLASITPDPNVILNLIGE